jgi:aspartate/methionine/tyrosine aminotransferase
MPLNPQATELNDVILQSNPQVLDLLSERGKAIFFPKRGILSQSAEAKGSAINATIGTALEDDGNPMALKSLRSLLTSPSVEGFNYAPSPGRPDIRKTWKEMLVRKNPLLKGKNISSPIVTSALTHGLSMAGYLFVDAGDTVISPDLYWENYDLIFSLAYGASIATFPAFTAQGGFNVDGLRSRLMQGTPGKRIVILNFPNNPTGYTVTTSEATRIREVLVEAADAGNTLLVVIDDAYFGLVFEPGILTESIFGLLCDAHQRILALKLDGPTKEDYVWGFRVGFATFGIAGGSAELYAGLEAKLGGAIRGNISNCSNLSQTMLLAAYTSAQYEAEKQEKFAVLKRRYEKMRDIFAAHPEYAASFRPLPFNSGYFMCIRTEKPIAEKLRKKLIESYSTGVIAQGDSIIRIAFSATPFDKLETLVDNVYKAAQAFAG